MSTKAYGTTIEYGNASTYAASISWTKLARVDSIEPPAPEADDIDASHLESEDETREFLPGWSDSGEGKFAVQYDDTQSIALHALYRTMKGWRVTPSDGSKWGFTGYIKAISPAVIDEEGLITSEVTIKVTGPLTPVAAV